MGDTLAVVISSTSLDLPQHRDQVRDACLRLTTLPLMMEYLPASDADAIAKSLELVDKADVYLGVFAYRYGYEPSGHEVSITEMEYNRAVEHGIPRLIFLMGEDHDIKPRDKDTGPKADKLERLRTRLGKEQVVNFFNSPADLRAQVIHSL